MTDDRKDLLQVEVVESRLEAKGIRSYFLKAVNCRFPKFTPGAHVDVYLPSGLVRQYSLIGHDETANLYHLAVLRDDSGRGGSIEFHDQVHIGSALQISKPRNNFPLAENAKRHLLIAGGIGITPMLAMANALAAQGADWQLHYCTKNAAAGPFLELLSKQPYVDRTVVHMDEGDPSRGMAVETVTETERQEGVHVYCCGPAGLMNRVRAAVAGWRPESVHFESFNAAAVLQSDQAFEVEVIDTGDVISVGADESILNALLRHGYKLPFLCTQGVCGNCIVDLVGGTPDHRDSVLFEDEKAEKIITCCSRAKSDRLILRLSD